jgi:hypothetical protein
MKIENRSSNLKGNYKYRPEDYEELLGLPPEMIDFYELLENYKENKTKSNRFRMEKQLNDLLFTIKHQVVLGNITPYDTGEMREYIREIAVSDD